MFFEILKFELRYRLKRPATYIYFGMFFLFAYLIAIVAGGAFESANVSFGGSGGKVLIDSPYSVSMFVYYLNYLGIIIIAAMVAGPVYRDFEYNTHSIFFTKPISKWDYLGGRFIGSLIVTLFVLLGIALGLIIGTKMPFVNQDKVGAFHLINYLYPYILFVIPNLICMGVIFFMLATLTRNMLPVYVGSVTMLILLSIANQLVKTLSNQYIASLIDPMGIRAVSYTAQYWTVAQKNSMFIPLTGVVLVNRLLWTGVGVGLFILLFVRFRFDQFSSGFKLRKIQNTAGRLQPINLAKIAIEQDFSFAAHFKQLVKTTRLEFKNIIRSPYFIAIAAAGMLFMFVSGQQLGKIYDTSTYPVTGVVADALFGVFYIFFIIIIVFYSGEMIWKERELKINQIMDALPVPNWVGFVSRFTSLIGIQIILLFMIMFCGIIIQMFYGYFHFEPLIYLTSLFGIRLIGLILFCVLTVTVQIIVNQKYLGFFMVIAYTLFTLFFMNSLGWGNYLYRYGDSPDVTYSAMNGYGHYVTAFLWFNFYWACFAVMLAIIANLFWIRGTSSGFKGRLITAKERFKGQTRIVFFVALLLFIGSGSYIYYNTHILNKYQTSFEGEKQQVDYEKKYKKYEHIPQPRIIAVKMNADIYPYEKKLGFKGYYVLKNKTSHPIDSVHVNLNNIARKSEVSFMGFVDSTATIKKFADTTPNGERDINVKAGNYRKVKPELITTTLVLNDSLNGYRIYVLPKPLIPGDSLVMNMDFAYSSRGFKNDNNPESINYNGTFVNSAEVLPQIGYNRDGELADNIERKKFGLAHREVMAPLTDSIAQRNNLISNDADWVRYDATLSTSADQTAITSGNLEKKWTEPLQSPNGEVKGYRNYFHYVSGSKILFFFPYVSAQYEVKEDKWNDVRLAIYYNKGHEYNLDRMMQGLKDGLNYYTANYGPYQFKEVKILEFPYQSFAQSFPNTIPFSENIGFIADVDDSNPQDIDYPYYVTAHELGHQWWAHQVIGANVDGVTMLDETMAQYSALMTMKHKYGPDKMKKFLRYEMDHYLRGRSFEREKETPLYKVEGQQYIHYNKGSCVMYALQDYIGEYKLDSALKRYIKAVAFQEPPYTTSLQFLQYISSAVPDSMEYIVDDMFRKIVLYNNKVNEGTWEKQSDGTYKVHFTVEAHKIVADSSGNEKDVPLNDWIDIGVFAKPSSVAMKPLYMQKRKITKELTDFDIVVKNEPYEAGIDPYNKLIDRTPDDNVKTLDKLK